MPRAAAYVVTTSPERTIGLAEGAPGTEMPYSVSMPMTRRTLMPEGYAMPQHPAATGNVAGRQSRPTAPLG